VLALCDKAVMLSKGRITSTGDVRDVVDDYVGDIVKAQTLQLAEREDRSGNGALRFTDIWFESNGRVVDSPTTGGDCEIVLTYDTPGGPTKGATFGVMFGALEGGAAMMNLDSEATGSQFENLPAAGQIRCSLSRFPLPPAQYFIHIWAESGGVRLDEVHSVMTLTVAGGDFYGTGRIPKAENRTVLVDNGWSVAPAEPQPQSVPAQSSSSSA
jgi:lipopolysaccharide transport system ATP-binding protein